MPFVSDNTTGTPEVVAGDVVPGAVDSGSGTLKVGGVVRSAIQTAKTAGTRDDLTLTNRGEIAASIIGGGAAADGVSSGSLVADYAGTARALMVAALIYNGASFDRLRVPVIIKDIPSQAVVAGTPINIWTPAAGKKFRLLGWSLSLSVAGGVILLDNAGGAFVPGGRTPLMAAAVGLISQVMGNGFLSAAANNVLKADVTANGNIQGFVFGTEE